MKVDELVWPFAVAYLSFVYGFAFVLICLGYALGRVPGFPASAERRYGAWLVALFDLLLRPFDGFSPVE